jgi:hypothetical protein
MLFQNSECHLNDGVFIPNIARQARGQFGFAVLCGARNKNEPVGRSDPSGDPSRRIALDTRQRPRSDRQRLWLIPPSKHTLAFVFRQLVTGIRSSGYNGGVILGIHDVAASHYVVSSDGGALELFVSLLSSSRISRAFSKFGL